MKRVSKPYKEANPSVSDIWPAAEQSPCITRFPSLFQAALDESSTILITAQRGAASLEEPATNFSENSVRDLDFQISRPTWEDLIRLMRRSLSLMHKSFTCWFIYSEMTIYSQGPGGCMNGTGTVTVPQLSVSMLPRDRLGTEVKLFLLSCCLTGPLHPGKSLPSWITTRFRFSFPFPWLGGERASLLTSPIGVQVDEGLSVRVLAGMSGVVTNLSDSRPFTGVLADELSDNGLPRNRRT